MRRSRHGLQGDSSASRHCYARQWRRPKREQYTPACAQPGRRRNSGARANRAQSFLPRLTGRLVVSLRMDDARRAAGENLFQSRRLCRPLRRLPPQPTFEPGFFSSFSFFFVRFVRLQRFAKKCGFLG